MTALRLAPFPLCAALLAAAMPAAHALQAGAPAAPVPDLAAAAAAGPASTAAYGARCIGAAHDDTDAFQAAIDTGHTVYAPAMGGRCHITRPLVMKTPGQIFGGDGRARTKIVIEPGFAGQGVFVAQTGEPGPVWRDFSVSFVQPDTDDRAKLTRYPPAFYAVNTPRFEMEHMGCYVATVCVDMKGNSGGATIADMQMSAFEVGISLDGSMDTVRLIDDHFFPFQMTTAAVRLMNERVTWLDVGRVDDLKVIGTLFFNGKVASFHGSETTANGFCSVTSFSNTSFDTFDAARGFMDISCGKIEISGGSISGDNVGGAAGLKMTGGHLIISHPSFISFGAGTGPSAQPFFDIAGSSKSTLRQSTGNLITCAREAFCGFPYFDLNHAALTLRNDQTVVELTSGEINFSFNNLSIEESLTYENAKIEIAPVQQSAARANIIANRITGIATGKFGRFIVISQDDFNHVMYNTAPNWRNVFPRIGKAGGGHLVGVYSENSFR